MKRKLFLQCVQLGCVLTVSATLFGQVHRKGSIVAHDVSSRQHISSLESIPLAPESLPALAITGNNLPTHVMLSKATVFTQGTFRTVERYYSGGVWNARLRTAQVFEGGHVTKYARVSLADQRVEKAFVQSRTYVYDANGRLIEDSDPAGDRWTYSYNDSGRVVSWLRYYGDTLYTRTTYTYLDQVILLEMLYETYDGQTWSPRARTTYYNYLDGFADSVITEQWGRNEWLRDRKQVFAKDSLSSAVMEVAYSWSDASWKFVTRITYRYDVSGNLIEQIQEGRSSTTWVPWTRRTYHYDGDGLRTEQLNEIWIGNSWVAGSDMQSTKIPGPSISLIAPNECDIYHPGDSLTIWWIGTGVNSVNIDFSSDSGATWVPVAASLPDTGLPSYTWTLPRTASNQCLMRIASSQNPSIAHQTSAPFTITPVYSRLMHSTGTVTMLVSNDGYYGTDPAQEGNGFRYKGGASALYSGGLVMGKSTSEMRGMVYDTQDLMNIAPLGEFTSDAHFDQRSSCVLGEVSTFYNVQITQQTASRTGDDFVFLVYEVKNISSTTLNNFYVGLLADWDIGAGSDALYFNIGGIDQARSLAYQNDSTLADPNYYGLVALNGMSGANVTAVWQGGSVDRQPMSLLYTIQEGKVAAGDNRMWIGSGPYSIPAGGQTTVGFAVAAGASLADLQAHADSARVVWNTGHLTHVPDEGLISACSLLQNYPNPFNPLTTIRYGLPNRSHVTLTVFNTLGQQVATLVNGEMEAGYHEVQFGGSGLSSGVYFYRIQAGAYTETKKLILAK